MRAISLRAVAWIAAGVAGLALAGVLVWLNGHGYAQRPLAVGGPFHLVDQDGRAVDQSILDGRWTAVYFGYTYCPDVCPTTLQMLGQAQGELGAKGKDFRVVFITVDPERDTPAQLKAYLSNQGFPAGAVGLTGAPAQVAQAAAAYGVYFQKAGSGANYT